MKFGKAFDGQQNPAWRDYYIDYKALKRRLKDVIAERGASALPSTTATAYGSSSSNAQSDAGAASGPDDEFLQMLEQELDKLEQFYLTQCDALHTLHGECVLECWKQLYRHKLGSDGRRVSSSHNKKYLAYMMKEGLHVLRSKAYDLAAFVDINRIALRKILKKHDKVTQTSTSRLVRGIVANERDFYRAEELADLKSELRGALIDVQRGNVLKRIESIAS
ncbi:phosphate system positive regulatory protein pho81 [Sorochytrium milnesiophthora]